MSIALPADASIRPPQVAGAFYPEGSNTCADLLEQCLSAAKSDFGIQSKILVAPHAGWVFSGAIAGSGYAGFRGRKNRIKRVVLLGPAHRVGFKGIAVTSADGWATPLGVVPIDWGSLRQVLAVEGVRVLDAAYAQEHSLEVHAPFIQRVFPEASIVPLLVGDAPAQTVAKVLWELWGGTETLIVISSDLSHFHDYDTARKLDAETSAMIERMQFEKIDGNGACGHRALAGALTLAREQDLRVTALDVRNSGDTRSGKDRVVGYGAYAMEYAHSARLDDTVRRRLVEAARFGVRFGLENRREPQIGVGADLSAPLRAQRASFVTLTLDGQLRGCIGSLIAHRPLISDVTVNAYKAAFSDHRFKPLAPEEAERMEVSVSILSTPRRMSFEDEADLVRQVRPDIDGLIMRDGRNQGLFLPSVWSGLPKAEQFIRHLKMKSQLSPDHWSPNVEVFRYTTESFSGSFRELG